MPIPDDVNSIKNLFADTKVDNIDIVDFWTSWQLSNEIRAEVDAFDSVLVGEGDSWYSISEAVYGLRELWWIIAMYNDVEDPFSIFYNGTILEKATEIKIPDQSSLGIIINEIREKRIERELNG